MAKENFANAVPSVAGAIAIINHVAKHPEGVRISDLVRIAGLSRATTYRICATLQATNYLEKDERGSYITGSTLIAAAIGAATQDNLSMRFYRAIEQIDALADKTVVCGVLNDRQVAYIATRTSNQPIGIQYRIGLQLPAHATATGKALISHLGLNERESWLAFEPYEALTGQTLTDAASLRSELDASFRRGYAVDDEETSIGMYCLAVAMKPLGGSPPAAVGVTVLKAQITDALRNDLITGLRQLAVSMYGQI